MKDVLRKLLNLSEIDAAVHALDQQLALYPRMLADMQSREMTLRKREEKITEDHLHARESRRRAELETATLRERINKYLVQQNQVKTNKEYEAITHEIDNVKARIDEFENVALESLEKEELLEHDKAATQKKREEMKAENDAERARIQKQIVEKRERLAEHRVERLHRYSQIPEELRESYDLLNERYPGGGLSPLLGNSCKGCGMQLVPQLARDARNATKMVRCAGCMRILYDPESLLA